MLVLTGEQIGSVRSLLNTENAHYPLLRAVISGRKRGKAFVDQPKDPMVGGILSDDGWFYLLGEGNEDFCSGLETILVKKVCDDKLSLLWFGISNEWRKRMAQHNSVTISDYPRAQYAFHESEYVSFASRDCVYQLESIGPDNVHKIFEYCEDVTSFWGCSAQLLECGFGFIVLHDGRIIGHAMSASLDNNEVEIDIQTDESYRGEGLATYLTSCLIDECIKRSLIPKWDCTITNAPSNKLAAKFGFKRVREYPFSLICPR